MDTYWQDNSWRRRLVVALEEAWPTVNRYATDAFWGIVSLVKTLITAIWQRGS